MIPRTQRTTYTQARKITRNGIDPKAAARARWEARKYEDRVKRVGRIFRGQ